MSNFNRRAFIAMGGASALSACQMSGDMMGAAMGGAGSNADFGQLVKALHAALDKVADQTEKLFEIQASYADVFGLKKQAAQMRGEAKAIRASGRTGVKFRQAEKLTKGLQKDINNQLNKGNALDAAAKRTLANGMNEHAKAIENAWIGGVMIAKVVLDARSAKKPSFTDIESLKYFKEIVADGPMAIKFLETSKSTYEDYAEAFEFKAKIPNIRKPKVKNLMGSGRA